MVNPSPGASHVLLPLPSRAPDIILSCRSALDSPDFRNAFNNINWDAMFVEIRRCIPSISAWMESCYSCQPFLLLGKDSIHSCCGVQQGDPLGPLGFALSLHPSLSVSGLRFLASL